jgi:hypothetical protein
MKWSATNGKMPYMEVSICFKKMEKREDEWDEPLPHPSVLWFKFQTLGLGRPEKYLLGGLSRDHSG